MLASTEVGLIGLAVMVLLVFGGMPIGVAMGVVGFVGFAYLSGIDGALGMLASTPYTHSASYAMSVLPLFVLMGDLTFRSGISRDLYQAAHKWFGRLPGGLAMATICAGAGFGAMCGSSVAATATFTSVAYPEMKKYNYNRAFAAATVAVTGTLAIMIPPSTFFIIYGSLTDSSIGKLFIAGIIPGLLLTLLYCLTVGIWCWLDPTIAPRGPSYSWKERFTSLGGAAPMLLLLFFVFGGMWLGFFTATEAGAIGALGAFIFLLVRGGFNRTNIGSSLMNTMSLIGMGIMILITANIFSPFMSISGLPSLLTQWLLDLAVPPIMVVAGMLVVYFLLGFAMDEMSMIVITTPLFLPVLLDMGVDPIWWGVMVCVSVQQGQLSPPVGMNLNVLCGLVKAEVPSASVWRAIMPYVGCLFVFMVVMIMFPDLATWLPKVAR